MKKLLLILIIAVKAFTSIVSYTDSIQSVIHCRFNENLTDRITTTTYTDSGGGSISYESSDILQNGQRLVLPGTKCIDMGQHAVFERNGSTKLVIGGRFIFDTLSTSINQSVFSIYLSSSKFVECAVVGGGGPQMRIYFNSSSVYAYRSMSALRITQGASVNILFYIHLSTNEIECYVNGISTDAMSWSVAESLRPDTLPNLTGASLKLGRTYFGGSPYYLKGKVDEFFISDTLPKVSLTLPLSHVALSHIPITLALGQSNGHPDNIVAGQDSINDTNKVWLYSWTSGIARMFLFTPPTLTTSLYPKFASAMVDESGKSQFIIKSTVGGSYLWHKDSTSWVGSFDPEKPRDTLTYLGKATSMAHATYCVDQIERVIIRNGESDADNDLSANRFDTSFLELQSHIDSFIAPVPIFYGMIGLSGSTTHDKRATIIRSKQISLHSPTQKRILAANAIPFPIIDNQVHTTGPGQDYIGQQFFRSIMLYNADSGAMVTPLKSLQLASGYKLTANLDTALRAASGFEILIDGEWLDTIPTVSGDTLSFVASDSVRYLYGTMPDTTNYLYDTAYGLRWAVLPFAGAFSTATSSIRIDSVGIWNGLYLKGLFAIPVDSVKIDSVLATDIVQTGTTLQLIPASPLMWRQAAYPITLYSDGTAYGFNYWLRKSNSGSYMFATSVQTGTGF